MKREDEWLRRIKSSKFNHGLVIYGVAYGLSFGFKLQSSSKYATISFTVCFAPKGRTDLDLDQAGTLWVPHPAVFRVRILTFLLLQCVCSGLG
jgi:hypothetical protein